MNLVTVSLMFGWGCAFTLLFTACIVIYIFIKTENLNQEKIYVYKK
tara:strand:- start:4841 stop:4978 length:138 start_codon:yes stop_codon:yes gene_type:complete